MRLKRWVAALASAALLGGCSFSLAQDITPPPNSELSNIPVKVVPATPASPPDAARGEALYAANCAPCHGAGGLGDGEKSGDLPVPVPAIGTAELAKQNTPMEWFVILSQGNLENFMPPFANSLSIQQRWDLLAYVYSLSGELALDDSGNLVAASETTATETGVQPTTASEAQLTTVAATGTVKNGSGGELPVGAVITLFAYHGQDQFTRTTTLREDGGFQFDDVPVNARNLYQVSIEYKGLIYFSENFTEADLQAGKNFELVVYEGTQDTSHLTISSLNLVFDFVAEAQVKVIEQVLLSNDGDLAVVPVEGGQALLHYELPSGVSNLRFDQGQVGDRYAMVADGFVDYRAVLPGENTYQVIYAFDLNYDRALEFVRGVEFPAHNIHIFLPQNEIQLQGANLVLVGEQMIGDVPYRVYQLNSQLEAGDQIALRLTGAHPLKSPFLIQLRADDFLVGLVALTVTVAIVAFWLRRRSKVTALVGSASNQIMDAIIVLDEQFENKQISKSEYKRKRARLKKRLSLALKKDGKL